MTHNTIQQLEQIKSAATDDFDRRLFGAILACDAAAKAADKPMADETEPGEMARCAQCDDLWPAEDLNAEGICPNCVICRHYEARMRRLERRRTEEGEYEISDADPGL
jgi:hypothetical protein